MSYAYTDITKNLDTKGIVMIWNRLIIEGNAVYEIDDECLRKKEEKNRGKNSRKGLGSERPQKGSRGE